MASLHALVLLVAASHGSDPVLLNFSSRGCAACRTMEPTVARLCDSGYAVQSIDVDQRPDLAQRFGIRPIPCFVLVADGQEVDRVVGAASFDRLTDLFHSAGFCPSQSQPPFRGQSPDDGVGATHPISPDIAHEPSRPGTTRLAEVRDPRRSLGQTPPSAASVGAPGSPLSPQQRAWHATVRLIVVDSTGQSRGTGTIIDTHGDEALVVTCGHIFRESGGKGEIIVELFAPGATSAVQGHLLSYEAEQRDIALVSIRPGIPVVPVPVAAPDYAPRRGEAAFSIGCDQGRDPTVQTTTISAVDRYLGSPNLEVLGHPVEGRSGGGLFSSDGRLIGVCNAADLEEDRGIYARLPVIHDELRKIGQERIFSPPQSMASTPLPDAAAAPTGGSPRTAVAPSGPADFASAVDADTEVICIVRSRSNPQGGNKVYVLDRPSADLIQRLAMESNAPGLERLAELPRQVQPGPRQHPAASDPGPVVRAQNR